MDKNHKIPASGPIYRLPVAMTAVGKGNQYDVTLECGHIRRLTLNNPKIPDVFTCPTCMVEANRRAYIQAKGW